MVDKHISTNTESISCCTVCTDTSGGWASMMATDTINFDGALRLADIARVLQRHHSTIRKQLANKTFPIPHLPRTGRSELRWSGPVVRRWLEENGGASARLVLGPRGGRA